MVCVNDPPLAGCYGACLSNRRYLPKFNAVTSTGLCSRVDTADVRRVCLSVLWWPANATRVTDYWISVIGTCYVISLSVCVCVCGGAVVTRPAAGTYYVLLL